MSLLNVNFYDIESLRNLFTLANYRTHEDPQLEVVDIYHLCDDKQKLMSDPDWQDKMRQRIMEKNLNFHGQIELHDLSEESEVRLLSRTFGVSDAKYINDPNAKSNYDPSFRLVCDTDPDYDPDKHPYFMGYNSYQYDTTMLAHYFQSVWTPAFVGRPGQHGKPPAACTFDPKVTAADMRRFNDILFLPKNKSQMPSVLARDEYDNPDYSTNGWRIRKNMLMSGRHLDVARLNEKQVKVALKRLLGMLGYQILESNKVGIGESSIETPDQLYDLVAYNVSDVVNLAQLFRHKHYQGQFELKKGLLSTYPELIYDRRQKSYKPDKKQNNVMPSRLTIDSSSAQFSTRSLCPYEHLTDIPVVSFDYPSEEQAKQMGIKRINVLDDTRDFFYKLYPQPELRKRFDVIYDYYKSVEGKNFNDSETYRTDFEEIDDTGLPYLKHPVHKLSEIPNVNTCLPYFDRYGNPTSCFVRFSTGGIHGAEYNMALYLSDLRKWNAMMADMNEAKRQFPDPVELRKAKNVTMPDGRVLPYKTFLQSGLPIARSQYKNIEKLQPILFKQKKSSTRAKKASDTGASKTKKRPDDDSAWSLNPKYTFTSACVANHEDFTSYYPNLLRRMEAFFNAGLGYDRYAEIFDQKERYGKLMKDKSVSADKRGSYSILRNGTKLILNSASGAADAAFENNIRVNNQIISMRIIGQLFSYRIGQAQSYAGASIPSTNTDGLYSVMEETMNNKILAAESADIGVDIEPEPLYLISKDSNNRIEINMKTGEIISASGGTLGCRNGPDPTKSLAHPAIIDWALAEYLIVASQGYKGLNLNMPFNNDIGLSILKSSFSKFDKTKLLMMYQTILASSPSSISYIYGLRDNDPEPVVLQHYNRIFIMKDGTPDTMHFWAAHAKAITPAMRQKRHRNNERPVAVPEPTAFKVLKTNGEPIDDTHTYPDKDIVTTKVTNIDPEWAIFVQNKDLHLLPDPDYAFIMDNLDLDKYLAMLAKAYNDNWRNKLPDQNDELAEEDDDEQPVEANEGSSDD